MGLTINCGNCGTLLIRIGGDVRFVGERWFGPCKCGYETRIMDSMATSDVRLVSVSQEGHSSHNQDQDKQEECLLLGTTHRTGEASQK